MDVLLAFGAIMLKRGGVDLVQKMPPGGVLRNEAELKTLMKNSQKFLME